MVGAFIKVKVPGARGCHRQILCIIYHIIDVTIDELQFMCRQLAVTWTLLSKCTQAASRRQKGVIRITFYTFWHHREIVHVNQRSLARGAVSAVIDIHNSCARA